jgi:hypothetical protein
VLKVPPSPSESNVRCIGTSLLASWQTEKERGVDHYELQYTYDGYVYHAYASVQPKGNGVTGKQEYVYEVVGLDPQKVAFRLQTVDTDGKASSSESVIGQQCKIIEELNSFYSHEYLKITSKTMQDFSYELFDLNGKQLVSGTSVDGSVSQPISLNSGIYVLRVSYQDGTTTNQKLMAY